MNIKRAFTYKLNVFMIVLHNVESFLNCNKMDFILYPMYSLFKIPYLCSRKFLSISWLDIHLTKFVSG